jgi:hypothetical protein
MDLRCNLPFSTAVFNKGAVLDARASRRAYSSARSATIRLVAFPLQDYRKRFNTGVVNGLRSRRTLAGNLRLSLLARVGPQTLFTDRLSPMQRPAKNFLENLEETA